MTLAPRVLMVGTGLGGRGGIASAVATLRAAGLFEREGVVFIATHVEGTAWTRLRQGWRGGWQVAALCLGRRPAIVHVHAASGASFVRKSLVLALARATGVRTVCHLHGGGFARFASTDAGPLLRCWIRHTLEASRCVIVLSPAWASFVHGFAPRARIEVVPNAVPLPSPLPWQLQPPSASPLQLSPSPSPSQPLQTAPGTSKGCTEPQRILFLGRVQPAKGIGELLAACARLAPRYPQLRLVLAGEGELDWARGRAAALGIGTLLELPGWLEPAARAEQLARASLFCLPSWAEGVPMAMLEAMAAGCPVVVSAVGGMPDVIRDGVDGVLVPPHDPGALAAAIEGVLRDPALGRRLAQAGRARIEQDYSTDKVCRQLAAIYAGLAADETVPGIKETE